MQSNNIPILAVVRQVNAQRKPGIHLTRKKVLEMCETYTFVHVSHNVAHTIMYRLPNALLG